MKGQSKLNRKRILKKVITLLISMSLIFGLMCPFAYGEIKADSQKAVVQKTGIQKTNTSKTNITKTNTKNKNDGEATIMFTGDLMAQSFMQRAYYSTDTDSFDYTPVFKYVKKVFKKADMVVGNLETCVSSSTNLPLEEYYRENGKPMMNVDAAFLDAIKDAGIKTVTMSNNHNTDGGIQGIYETLDAVDEAGIKHTGLYRDSKEKRYMILKVDNIKVGIISYAYYYNDLTSFTDVDIAEHLSYYSKDQLKKDVKAVKKAGAEYVIACLHCGTEYSDIVSLRQQEITKYMISHGVDYVIGHHPHVIQPGVNRSYKKTKHPVIYSLGNLTTTATTEKIKESIVVSITLKKDKKSGKVTLKKNDYIPCYVSTVGEDEYVIIPEGVDKELDKEYIARFYDARKRTERLGMFKTLKKTKKYDEVKKALKAEAEARKASETDAALTTDTNATATDVSNTDADSAADKEKS